MKSVSKALAVLAATLISTSAIAVPTAVSKWDVSDAAGNCATGDHGLWTNKTFGNPSCNDNYFSFQAGSTLTQFDDGTAVLDAIAINPDGLVADIDITFGGFTTSSAGINLKNGGGATAAQQATWVFYTSVLAGSEIDIDGTDYTVAGLRGTTALQIGDGANDKTNEFGASSWLDMYLGNTRLNHWDLNMDLTATVPAPAMVLMLATGLLAFGFAGRRRG